MMSATTLFPNKITFEGSGLGLPHRKFGGTRFNAQHPQIRRLWLETWLSCPGWEVLPTTSHRARHVAMLNSRECGKLWVPAGPRSLVSTHDFKYFLNQVHLWQVRKQDNGIWGCELTCLRSHHPVPGTDRTRKDAYILTCSFHFPWRINWSSDRNFFF